AQVSSTWPANGGLGVAADLAYIVLHFDRCIIASLDTTLHLTAHPHVHDAALTNDLDLRLPSTAGMPGRTLVFPLLGSKPLGSNRRLTMLLEGEAAMSCDGQAPVCSSFEASFRTVETAPRAVRTDFVADRWLRTTFDLPVEAASAHRTFRVVGSRARVPG
ncbi:unnamed protein product, partial [Polarella glacialis]